jgi:dTDP-4-amino-4,6-dideoxygalactose transaminase
MTYSKRIYLSPPHMSGTEVKYVKEAFDSNWIAPLGPNVDAFENALAEYCEVGYAAALSSGTAGIHLALIMLGVKAGDEVFASTFTFSATINPIVYLGATPVLIDSEDETWNMDPGLLEEAIKDRIRRGQEKRLKAIVIVHLYGMPARMEEIIAIAGKYGIPVIEDAAEALGSRLNGKPLGSFGRIGVLSFNGNKIITTSGGGALVSDDRGLIERSRFLATQARDKAPHYQHSHIGYNYRMSNVLAGIGRGQMEVIEERVKRRREIFRIYNESLGGLEGIVFPQEPSSLYFSNRWLTTILINRKKTGDFIDMIQEQLEERNIETRPLWKPMHMQPVFSDCPVYLNNVSERLFKEGLCLPSGSNMSDEDINRVIDSMIHIYDKSR